MLGSGDARPRSTQHASADTAARRSAERCSKLFAFAPSESIQAAACSMCRERARNCERASACACREFDAHNSFDKQVAIIHPEPQRTTLIVLVKRFLKLKHDALRSVYRLYPVGLYRSV